MQGDPQVIEYLNKALTNELTAINQYWLHYRVLKNWGIDKLVIAIPEGFEAGAIAARARRMNAEVTIFARAHSDDEVDHLIGLGVDQVVMGEREIAGRLTELLAASPLRSSS